MGGKSCFIKQVHVRTQMHVRTYADVHPTAECKLTSHHTMAIFVIHFSKSANHNVKHDMYIQIYKMANQFAL